jgi:hypothetical protein
VTQSIPLIAQNRSLRLLLVTDPADKKVPIAQQTGFVDKMRQAGCQIPQFFVEATDEDHHGVVIYSQLVAAGCVLGKTDGQIARGQHDRQADRRVPSTMSEDVGSQCRTGHRGNRCLILGPHREAREPRKRTAQAAGRDGRLRLLDRCGIPPALQGLYLFGAPDLTL